MKVLFLSSEVAPFSKTGGLGDVAAALPSALAELGHEVCVVTPLYASVPKEGLRSLPETLRLRFPFEEERAGLWLVQPSRNHRVLFLDHPGYYGRSGLYGDDSGDYPDNARRFGFFSQGALAAAQRVGFNPDVVHLNDWQTGLAALWLRRMFQGTPLAEARSLFTIHNLAYQGLFPPSTQVELGLPPELFAMEALEFYGKLSFIKAGLVFADLLSTVSPTYAREIQTPELGCGLDGLLRAREAVLRGILNGIDVKEWNPRADRFLPQNYSAEDLTGKAVNKKEALKRMGLSSSDAVLRRPLFVSVSRLVEQKGTDLLIRAMEKACEKDVSFLALGSGEARFEKALGQLAKRFPDKVGVRIGFDASLSHLLEAAADFFLMPSRYEPCGLNQMYSLAYGTIPIVHATGGLDDTVTDIDLNHGTGIKFLEMTESELLNAFQRALKLYADSERMAQTRRRGMALDFSWAASARQYEALYQRLTNSTDAPKFGIGAQ